MWLMFLAVVVAVAAAVAIFHGLFPNHILLCFYERGAARETPSDDFSPGFTRVRSTVYFVDACVFGMRLPRRKRSRRGMIGMVAALYGCHKNKGLAKATDR